MVRLTVRGETPSVHPANSASIEGREEVLGAHTTSSFPCRRRRRRSTRGTRRRHRGSYTNIFLFLFFPNTEPLRELGSLRQKKNLMTAPHSGHNCTNKVGK